MLNIYHSNRQELLVDALIDLLKIPKENPFVTELIAVQSAGMRSWITIKLTSKLGIWAGQKLPFPNTLIEHLFSKTLCDNTNNETVNQSVDQANNTNSINWLNREVLSFCILQLLDSLLKNNEFIQLKDYLKNDTKGVKQYQLSKAIAQLFDDYALYRPQMILDWESKKTSGWQPMLWNAIKDEIKFTHFAEASIEFINKINKDRYVKDRDNKDSYNKNSFPKRITLFGISSLPPQHLKILTSLPDEIEVNLFLMCPSKEYFADIKKMDINYQHANEGNPLLVSMGKQARDFQSVLWDTTGDRPVKSHELYSDPLADNNSTMLSVLQSDIFNFKHRTKNHFQSDFAALPIEIEKIDNSISVHSCHSPMRQIEVLHDQLLALLDTKHDGKNTLQPEDIIVMAPDIETFVPCIESVFNKWHNSEAVIPYRINDRTKDKNTDVGDAFLQLLKLVNSRMTLQNIAELLLLSPVRKFFSMSLNDVKQALEWAKLSGIRFGADESHRVSMGQPSFNENTWRFGLQRLMLGVGMANDGVSMFKDVLPYQGIEGNETLILGNFLQFCDILFKCLKNLKQQRSISMWQKDLTVAIEALIETNTENEHEHQIVRNAIVELVENAKKAHLTKDIELDVIISDLENRITSKESIRGFLSGGVTFCSLLPMRSIPFKVVCIIGLNDGKFPRNKSDQSFDLMAQKQQAGDRNQRNDDRYLFLESLLSARQNFMIFYEGQNIRTNKETPPCVLITQLLDIVDESFDLTDKEKTPSAQITTKHPLHAFSYKYFENINDENLFSYKKENYLSAQAALLSKNSFLQKNFIDKPLSAETETETIELAKLILFFKMPSQYFATKVLGISLSQNPEQYEDREPMLLKGLSSYEIGNTLVENKHFDLSKKKWKQLLSAKGILPLGTYGKIQFDKIERQASLIIDAANQYMSHSALEPLNIDILLKINNKNIRLVGKIENINEQAKVNFIFSKLSAKNKLATWVEHLALNCVDQKNITKTTVLIGRHEKNEHQTGIVELAPVKQHAHKILADLASIYLAGLKEPLRFFPEISFNFAKSFGKDDTEAAKQRAIENAKDSFDNLSESMDIVVSRMFRNCNPVSDKPIDHNNSFEQLSLEVFLPLLDCIETAKRDGKNK